MSTKHTKLQEVTRNADEIQTTFIGFLLDGRVIEIGDINHKPNRDNTRRIVTAANYHHRLREALESVDWDKAADWGIVDMEDRDSARALLAEMAELEDKE